MAMEFVKETKLFSQHCSDKAWLDALRYSSVSNLDAAHRKAEYEKLFSKYEGMKEAYMKMFSGTTELPLLSNQYFNATVASFVRSFAGYFTIERDMDQPTALLWYDDVLGVVDDREVLPNLGKENLEDLDYAMKFEDQEITAKIELGFSEMVIPRSFHGTFVSSDSSVKIELLDDGNGNILAPAGILTSGTINYKTGAIVIEVASASFIGGKYSFVASRDVPGTPSYGVYADSQKNRFKLGMKQIMVTSAADELIGESNLVMMAQAQKSLGQNPMEVMGAKLVELYTKVINKGVANQLMKVCEGNAHEIEVTSWETGTFYDYNSRLNAFSAKMVDIDTDLAEQSVKGVEATAYLVGKNAGNWFRKMRATGEFVEQKGSTYVNDLLGFYHDIPVVRHIDVPSNDFYASIKTAGGELAPIMFGQYLPLTNTPAVGSYSNPTQVAQGVFYQIGMKGITSALVKKATLV